MRLYPHLYTYFHISPFELINDPNSAFHKMCKNSGEFDKLSAMAKKKHQLVDV